MTRTVHCQYENKDAEGLDFVPWPGELGKRVFANVGKAGWAAWLAHQTMLINENRLSPLDPKHRAFLETEMEKFLFGGGAEKPAGYVPDDSAGCSRAVFSACLIALTSSGRIVLNRWVKPMVAPPPWSLAFSIRIWTPSVQ